MIDLKEEKMKALNKKILDAYPNEEIVLGRGNLNSPIVLIGEAPGRKEVELKEPFVGQAGKNLDEFLEALELEKEDIYITNSVKYRPTKVNPKTGRLSNRTPTVKEIEAFRNYLFEEIDIIKPKIIVTLGNTSLKALFKENIKIGDVHGKLISVDIKDNKYNIFPLYHPAAIIYNRSLKEIYLNDLQNLKREISKM